MTVWRVQLDKAEILRLPEKDRRLLLGIAHMMNEVMVLWRAAHWSRIRREDSDHVTKGQLATQFFYLRMLAGKEWEAWEMLHQSFFPVKVLSEGFRDSGSPEGQAALAALKKYFNGPNLAKNLRNKLSFHYAPEEIDDALAKVGDDVGLHFDMYVEDEGKFNTLYYFAEELVAHATIARTGLVGSAAITKLEDELVTVSGHFVGFGESLVSFLLKRNDIRLARRREDAIDLGALPSFATYRLPYFTDPTEARQSLRSNPAEPKEGLPPSGSVPTSF